MNGFTLPAALRGPFSLLCLLWLAAWPGLAPASAGVPWPEKTYYRSAEVLGEQIFYREAGSRQHPTLVLLHGFPASSHTYRELIPLLSGSYHVIAPDYLGSGFSARPSPELAPYTFERLAEHVAGLLDVLGIERYSLYMQDFGAPVGYRLLLRQPGRLQGLIVQNANAYREGLTPARLAFFKAAHHDRSAAATQALHRYVSAEAIRDGQYLRDVQGREQRMSPDTWTHDLALLEGEAGARIQVQLFQDYWNNIVDYPRWQAWLREHQPPTLITWGRHDPAFIAAGATAYLRDVPQAELHLLDAGHFALEEQPVEIAQRVRAFLQGLKL
ncbi:alpha/beta fold hydrolase [Pseudomonas sp. NPDC007930]|uniref:alpha/beta fold hydrolase n=1 Tax=Pseudomonas sp. NPDC007930 TaxID=3364417 RepID=UPI0036E0FEC3